VRLLYNISAVFFFVCFILSKAPRIPSYIFGLLFKVCVMQDWTNCQTFWEADEKCISKFAALTSIMQSGRLPSLFLAATSDVLTASGLNMHENANFMQVALHQNIPFLGHSCYSSLNHSWCLPASTTQIRFSSCP
jgi:hypothetical protein